MAINTMEFYEGPLYALTPLTAFADASRSEGRVSCMSATKRCVGSWREVK